MLHDVKIMCYIYEYIDFNIILIISLLITIKTYLQLKKPKPLKEITCVIKAR